MDTRRQKEAREGCGFVIFICLASCVMLVINGTLVATLYNWSNRMMPAQIQHPKIGQVIQFVVPVLLLFPEWWLLDAVFGWLRQRREARLRG